jgi:hypothetical protein
MAIKYNHRKHAAAIRLVSAGAGGLDRRCAQSLNGGLLTVDGIQLVAGDRVLVKDETSAIDNDLYSANKRVHRWRAAKLRGHRASAKRSVSRRARRKAKARITEMEGEAAQQEAREISEG